MFLCDSSFWLALSLSPHVHHRAARAWFEAQSRASSIAFCRATQLTYLRLLTTRAVVAPYGLEPLSCREAWEAYDALTADYRVFLIRDEPPGLDRRWRSFSEARSPSPKLWMDAYLAASAVTGGYRLVTFDRGFAQFAELDALILS